MGTRSSGAAPVSLAPSSPQLTGPGGPVSEAGSATGISRASVETPSGRNNLRPGGILIGYLRGVGGAKATVDWLAAPAPTELDWEAECRSDWPWEYRALPVRVVSGGPGAGGGWHPAAAGAHRVL